MEDNSILSKFIEEQEKLGQVTIIDMEILAKKSNQSSPEEKLNAAVEQFEILKDNLDNFSVREKLEMASSIRDNLSNDKSIITSCNENQLLSEKRKLLLDDMRKFQMDVIEEQTISDKESDTEKYGRVIDFSKAKEDLGAMIEQEQSLNLFEETSEPKIYQSISNCKTHQQTLIRVADSCKNGKYKVLIMGDFQSGKSTTVDALCDGRHVCAIGKGIATSAVLVTVTYSAKEYPPVIHWRTKNQFTCIFNRIRPYIQSYNWDDFDLDSQSSRNQLKKEINKLRNSKSSNLGQGDTKFMMLCDFVLHYYDTNELKQKKQSLRTIVDTSEITKFPDKGETIWKKKGVAGFEIDEILFIFIESVDCFVSSETLRNLNCTIIDSPGLFNSAYDTMVTEQAMIEAHAIMYVLPFEKAMREDVCASLYKIKNDYPDVHRKLFIVNNSRPGSKAVYESNCETIKTMFGANKIVPRYDAKLSYLLQVKHLYDIGKASITDYKHLLTVEVEDYDMDGETTYDNFDDAWIEHISAYERILKGNYENGLQKSGFLNVIDELKKFIEINESYAVIVSNGIAPMIQEISGIKNSIYRSYIEPYISSQEEIGNRWENRIKEAKEFQKLVSKLIRKAVFDGDNSLIDRMAIEEYGKLFTGDFYIELSREIAGVIYDNKKSLLSIKSLFKKSEFKAKVVEKLKPLIEKKVVDIVSGKIKYLDRLIESKQDQTVTNMFTPVMDNVEFKLLQEWHKLFNDDNFKMQDYLVLVKDLSPAQNINYSDSPYDASVLSENTDRLILFQGFVSEISTIIAGVVSMIAGYVALVFTDPTGISEAIAFAIAGVLGLMGGFVAIIAPNWAREKSVNKLGELLISKIKTNEVETGFNSLVRKQLESIILKYIAAQKVDIQKMKNERDLAMQPTDNREALCFKAIEETKRLNEQLKAYCNYLQKHLVINETI